MLLITLLHVIVSPLIREQSITSECPSNILANIVISFIQTTVAKEKKIHKYLSRFNFSKYIVLIVHTLPLGCFSIFNVDVQHFSLLVKIILH